MEIAIFAKKRTTKDGKPFYSFLSTLTRKDGTAQTVTVKFRDECGSPKPEKCPMNIKVEKGNMNLASSTFTREDTGEPATSYKLWVSTWEPGSPWVDTSLDEFDI